MRPEQAFSIGRELFAELPYEPINGETQKLSYLERFKNLGKELYRYGTDKVYRTADGQLYEVKEYSTNFTDPTDISSMFGNLTIRAKYCCIQSTRTKWVSDPNQLEEISAQWSIEGRLLPEERITKELITDKTEPQSLDPLFQLLEDSIESTFPGFLERQVRTTTSKVT